MGTLFEAGYAYAKHVPIIYYWEHANPDDKFNLMLAFSGVTVCSSEKELNEFLDLLVKENFDFTKCEKEFEGNIE
jgi:nucleoside 2-deoxyribosyltransferase